jgi:hypothetical protein
MASFHVKFVEWSKQVFDGWPIPRFNIYLGHEQQLLFIVGGRLPYVTGESIRRTIDANNVESKEKLGHVFLRHVMRRIEQGLHDGILPTAPTREVQWIDVMEADMPLLERLLQEKTCIYQLQEGRDLLCSAADPNDPDKVGQIELRTVAPTSRAVCRTCTLPHTDYLCSHLMHPRIRRVTSMNVPLRRLLERAECDLGRDAIGDPSRCHAGGHACWERIIEPQNAFPAVPLSPLMLPESLDFLDAVWRLAFGTKQAFLRPKNTTSIAKLALPCTTREEFESHLSALADTMKAIDIPDTLLTGEDQKTPKDQTFVRLLACLKHYLDEAEYQQIEPAVGVLRAVNSVRVALQHGGAARELPNVLSRLGIPYPPEWGEAWNHIQTHVVNALGVIRETVYRKGLS